MSAPLWVRAGVLAALAAGLHGCGWIGSGGESGPNGAATSHRGANALTAAHRSSQDTGNALDPGRPFQLQGLGATLYGVEGVPQELTVRAAARASARLGTFIEGDACLERAADILLRRSAQDCSLWANWIEEPALHHAGCYESGTLSFLFCSDDDDVESALDEIEAALAKDGRTDLTHLGISRRRGDRFQWAYAVLMSQRRVRLASFPRNVSSGLKLTLEGSLTGVRETLTAFQMDPTGQVIELPVRMWQGGRFSIPVVGLRESGEHWLELMVSDRSGPHVAALFPVYVDVPIPKTATPPTPIDMKSDTPEQAEVVLYELVNLERGQRGLPLLSFDPMLAHIARKHARAMRDSGFFAHLDPVGRGPRERAVEEGYRARILGENLARSPDAATAHEDLMGSPAHRANLLDPRFTHVGIGVEEGTGSAGKQYWVVENFSLPQRELSREEAEEVLAEKLDEQVWGSEFRYRPERSRTLDRVAAKLVRKAGSSSLNQLNTEAQRLLVAQGVRYRKQVLIRQQLTDPEELQPLPDSAREKDRYGFAVEIAPSADGTLREYTVLILMIR